MNELLSFRNIDNTTSLNFLAGYASSLASEDLISERLLEKFKRALSTVASQIPLADQSALELMLINEPEFIEVLSARYSVAGFAWNHLRSNAKNILSETCARLASWSDLCLKKAELFMNKPFLMQLSSGEKRRELFPSVLADFAKGLQETVGEINVIIHSLSLMRPASILDTNGGTYEIEQRIAIQLGFAGIETETLSFCRKEEKSLRKLALVFDELAVLVDSFIGALRLNSHANESLRDLEIAAESLNSECKKLLSSKFELSSNFGVLEARRFGILFSIHLLNRQISRVADLFVKALLPTDPLSANELLTYDVERALTCALIRKDYSTKEAFEAAKDLFTYCRHHRALPEILIKAELKKINPHLSDEILDLASQLTSNSPSSTPGGLPEKQRFIEVAKSIRKSLNIMAPFYTSLCAALIWVSCGVKTPLVKEVPDPRPPLAFLPSGNEQPPMDKTKPMLKTSVDKEQSSNDTGTN